jgi:hypothetical protein
MCSAPVHVKLHVSLQQTTWSGESSGLEPGGYTIAATAVALRCCWDDSEMEGTPDVCCSAADDDGTPNGLGGGDAVSLFATRWIVSKSVNAAAYARDVTASMNGVSPCASL